MRTGILCQPVALPRQGALLRQAGLSGTRRIPVAAGGPAGTVGPAVGPCGGAGTDGGKPGSAAGTEAIGGVPVSPAAADAEAEAEPGPVFRVPAQGGGGGVTGKNGPGIDVSGGSLRSAGCL